MNKLDRAVRFATMMIKEKQHDIYLCIQIASRYYDIDIEEIRKEIQSRSGKKRKGKSTDIFKYYAFCGDIKQMAKEDSYVIVENIGMVVKAKNMDNAISNIQKKVKEKYGYNDSSCMDKFSFASICKETDIFYSQNIFEFKTKAEAENKIEEIQQKVKEQTEKESSITIDSIIENLKNNRRGRDGS